MKMTGASSRFIQSRNEGIRLNPQTSHFISHLLSLRETANDAQNDHASYDRFVLKNKNERHDHFL
jgi:hypothetical protein